MDILTTSEIQQITNSAKQGDIDACITVAASVEENINNFILGFLDNLKDVAYPPQVSDQNPNVQRKYNIAVSQQRKKNYPDAINTLKEAISLNPGNLRLKEWLAVTYIRQSDIASAKRILEKEIPESYNNLVKAWNLCHIYFLENNLEMVLKHLSVSLITRENNKRLTQIALAAALRLRNNEFLIKNLSRLEVIDAYVLGLLLAFRANDQASINRYKSLITGEIKGDTQIIPGIKQRLSNQESFDLAKHFIDIDAVESGIGYFKGRVKAKTTLAWVSHRILGDLYVANGQHDKAIEHYVYEFNESENNPKLHITTKRNRIIALLRFCEEHQLWAKGFLLLERAPKYDVKRLVLKQLREKFEQQSQDSVDNKALKMLLEAMSPLQRINNVETVMKEVDLIRKYCESLTSIYGDEAHSTVSCVNELIADFSKFNSTADFASKAQISHGIFEKYSKFEDAFKSLSTNQIQELIVPLKKCMRYVINDVGSQTHSLPKLGVKILNKYLPNDGFPTSIVVELHNDSKFNIVSASVNLKSLTGGYEIKVEEKDGITNLAAGERWIVLFEGVYKKAVPIETFALQTTFSTSSLDNISPEDTPEFSLPIKKFDSVVAGGELQNRYISVGSIPPTRPENFHGRDDILRIIRASVSGGELREALFLSGLRRVGKTSVLQFLLGNPPENTVPVLIRVDRYTPKTAGEFLLAICQEIDFRLQELNDQQETLLPASYEESLRDFDTHPAPVFSGFLAKVNKLIRGKKLLLMFDEFQVVSEEIAKNYSAKLPNRISTDVLDIIRAHIEDRTFFALLTGSLLFDEIRAQIKGYDRLWGSIKVRDVAFIDKEAVQSVLQEPMISQGVFYTDHSVDQVIKTTKGYPVFVQLIGVEIVNILNKERRLVVAPQDVDLAAKNIISEQSHLFQFWWDEKRLEMPMDFEIIKTILNGQKQLGAGVSYDMIQNVMSEKGFDLDIVSKRAKRLNQLHILDNKDNDWCSINSLILEGWLAGQFKSSKDIQRSQIEESKVSVVGIFVDYENVYFRLKELREVRLLDKAFLEKTDTDSIAMKLIDVASKYGNPREKWVVADWYSNQQIKNEEHQRVFKKYGWKTDLPQIKDPKKEKSDHALRDLVHEILDGRKIDVCILVSGDGDFSQLVTYLVDHGKRVIVWGMKGRINGYYKDIEKWGKIEIGYIDSILFD